MSKVKQVLDLISQLDLVETAQLTLWLTGNTHSLVGSDHPLVVASPGVCGGSARLIRTRVPIWTLERMRQAGVSEAEILRSFPNLCAADLVQAWSYVSCHREEIERDIRENEE